MLYVPLIELSETLFCEHAFLGKIVTIMACTLSVMIVYRKSICMVLRGTF